MPSSWSGHGAKQISPKTKLNALKNKKKLFSLLSLEVGLWLCRRGGWVGGPLSCLPGGPVWPCSSSLYEHNLNVLNILLMMTVSLSHYHMIIILYIIYLLLYCIIYHFDGNNVTAK